MLEEKELGEELHEALRLLNGFLDKQISFSVLRGFDATVEVPYWEIVSGKPAGEVYHREVYVTFSKEVAEHCLSHILDYIEDWESGNWLYGPHIYEREGNPAHTFTWTGFREEAAPLWRVDDIDFDPR